MSALKIVTLSLLSLAAVGCSACRETQGTDASDSLGSLRTRDVVVRLETGQRFSLFATDGSPIAVSLGKAEFQRRFPRVYHEYEKAVAAGELGDITIDASAHTPDAEIRR